MDCRDAQRFVQLRLDDEIEPIDCLLLDRHLEGCTHCKTRVDREQRFHDQLRAKLQEASAAAVCTPAGLRSRILARADAEAKADRFPVGRVVGGALAVTVLAALSYGSSTPNQASIVEETVARHSSNLPPEIRARALDDEEVHEFLQRNLRYPIALPHFNRGAVPVRFVGARLSNIRDRDVAYMMYDQRGAKLSLFAYPSATGVALPEGFERRTVGDRELFVGRRRGYNVVSWKDRNLFYSLVSDVDPGELVQLASTARP